MMHCEEYLIQLNARQDGELSPLQAAALESHLAECGDCRAAAEGFESLDAELRAAFAPRRAAAAALADRVAAEVRAMAAVVAATPAPAPAPHRGWHFGELSFSEWGRTLLAMAAGFLLAVALLRAKVDPQAQPGHMLAASTAASTAGRPAGRLVIASGPVQMRPNNNTAFLGCTDGSTIKPASVLRTGDNARCELSLEGGNLIRLDRNTEITLHKPDRVEVNSGRLWAASKSSAKPIEIISSGCSITPRTPAEMAIERQAKAVQLIVVDGSVKVASGHDSKQVGPGEQLQVADGRMAAPSEPRDALLETAWVNGMLAARASDQAELRRRVDALLARIGTAKLALLYEDELRRLGDGAVPPLVAYLRSTAGAPDNAQRESAARIVADVAQPRRIGDLVALLEDANPQVRYHAARGLERLTGRDQGLPAESWKADASDERDAARQRWQEWWTANSGKYAAVQGVTIPQRALPTAPLPSVA